MLKLEKVQKYVKKGLKKKFRKLEFEYIPGEDNFRVITNLYIEKLDVDLCVGATIGRAGNTNFIAMFTGELEATPEALRLVNRFNDNHSIFCALIKEKTSALELTHFFECDIEAAYKSYVPNMLIRLGSIVDEPNMQKLASLMKK